MYNPPVDILRLLQSPLRPSVLQSRRALANVHTISTAGRVQGGREIEMNRGKNHKPYKKTPTVERFFKKIDISSGCWEWTGSKTWGYGTFYDGNKSTRAHRWLYEHLNGPIPNGMDLDHLCRNRSCCHPLHVEPVTRLENVMRGMRAITETCRAGHKTQINVETGRRRCFECEKYKSIIYRNRYKGRYKDKRKHHNKIISTGSEKCPHGHIYRIAKSGLVYCYDCARIRRKEFRLKHGYWRGSEPGKNK